MNKSEIKNRVQEELTNSASGRQGWTGPSGPRYHPTPPCFATFKLLCTRAFRKGGASIQYLPAIFITKKQKVFQYKLIAWIFGPFVSLGLGLGLSKKIKLQLKYLNILMCFLMKNKWLIYILIKALN